VERSNPSVVDLSPTIELGLTEVLSQSARRARLPRQIAAEIARLTSNITSITLLENAQANTTYSAWDAEIRKGLQGSASSALCLILPSRLLVAPSQAKRGTGRDESGSRVRADNQIEGRGGETSTGSKAQSHQAE